MHGAIPGAVARAAERRLAALSDQLSAGAEGWWSAGSKSASALFEEKSFSGGSEGSGGIEPRETADVTGDSRADLLLAHDRVLLYPQDDGRPEEE